MKILFLDQSGKPGGAELCLLDIAKPYRDRCLVALLADGPFRDLLEQHQIPVQVLSSEGIQVRKDSGWRQGFGSLAQLLPLITQVVQLSRNYDLIYANTQKALVVGALAAWLGRRPLVYHLHDILSPDHFSSMNRRLAVTLANRFSSLVIANSEASQTAFIAAGGRAELTQVIYNGFEPQIYQSSNAEAAQLRQQLGLEGQFVVGHFSRLSPWKGQHVLLEALAHCPQDVMALFVGDALFGEQQYVEQLHQQVNTLGLQKRVRFLGFRSDVVTLMKSCDLIAHTSTAPEPFGRVIVEAMLCGKPVVAAKSGGAIELITPEVDGWLATPGNPQQLAAVINLCRNQPERSSAIAHHAQIQASQRFDLDIINQKIAQLLGQTLARVPQV
ncbi:MULTISPECIES: glycosyltransferase [Trichocoleus]|uniref:Glycosyltransferase n=1 Tax=Trichocoleus desertorum GB2-A4 TaxID=2933944 RepID=A0ABV0J6Z7_9CYAN|nr:glycosyltransferase [Trichocoleus sp. FACHB-46]MBD1863880.1 glycosyltransferase [Trichocoleus sp. FACHB-46]